MEGHTDLVATALGLVCVPAIYFGGLPWSLALDDSAAVNPQGQSEFPPLALHLLWSADLNHSFHLALALPTHPTVSASGSPSLRRTSWLAPPGCDRTPALKAPVNV